MDSAARYHRTGGSLGVDCADLDHGSQLDQLGFVFVCVVLAEQQLGAGRQLRAYTRGGTTAVAAIGPGQFRTYQSCVHGTSSVQLWCVCLLCQTFSVLALFPRGSPVCRVSLRPRYRGSKLEIMGTHNAVLVHLCADHEWQRASEAGAHRPASLAEAGFIHLSSPEQVHLPANRLYAGRTDLVLLSIDPARLSDPVRWEPGVPTDPESMLFPHLYGPLPAAAVTSVTRYLPAADGSFAELPATRE